MSKLIWHVTMSVDGCIAGPDHEMEWAFAYMGSNRIVNEVRDGAGAILGGRRWHDVAMERYDGRAGIYGGNWQGPVLVLTHSPPTDPPDREIRFVSGGIEDAVAAAREAADGRSVLVFGADLARQCLEAGLLDEIVIHLAPILLGDGIRLDTSGVQRVTLERVDSDTSSDLTDLRFRVVR
jgi:dihydrofolate reductase